MRRWPRGRWSPPPPMVDERWQPHTTSEMRRPYAGSAVIREGPLGPMGTAAGAHPRLARVWGPAGELTLLTPPLWLGLWSLMIGAGAGFVTGRYDAATKNVVATAGRDPPPLKRFASWSITAVYIYPLLSELTSTRATHRVKPSPLLPPDCRHLAVSSCTTAGLRGVSTLLACRWV
jgi:hypothetical protein